jgi:hypothetical protein
MGNINGSQNFESVEKPKEVQMSFEALEKMQKQIGFAMATLGYGWVERQSLDKAYGVLRDLQYRDHCPHAERSVRLVPVPVETVEQIERTVNGVLEGRGDHARCIMDEVRFVSEKRELEHIRFKIQEILHAESQRSNVV